MASAPSWQTSRETTADHTSSSWDDWVPQDRLRKLTDDNRELAANLKKELAAASAPKAALKPTGKTRRGQGSEFGSGRGSEERTSSVPAAGGRGSKRARDNDIEKVRGPIPRTPTRDISPFSPMMSPFLDTSTLALEHPDPLGQLSGLDMSLDSPTKATGGNSGHATGSTSWEPPAANLEPDMEVGQTKSHQRKGRKTSKRHSLDLELDLKPYVPRAAAVKAASRLSATASKGRPSLDDDVDEPVKKTKGKPAKKKQKTSKKQSKPAKVTKAASSSSESEPENVGVGIGPQITPTTRRASLGLRPRQVTNYDEDAEVPDSEDEVVATILRSARSIAAQRSTSPTIASPKPTSSPHEHPSSFSPDTTKPPARTTGPLDSPDMSRRPSGRFRRSQARPEPETDFDKLLKSGQRFTPTELAAHVARLNLTTDQILQLPPPTDEPEQVSNYTASKHVRTINAQLIGGATIDERNLITEEMAATEQDGRKYRPTFVNPVARRDPRAPNIKAVDKDKAVDLFKPDPNIPDDRSFPESDLRESLKPPGARENKYEGMSAWDTESESSYHGEGPEPAESSLRESLKPNPLNLHGENKSKRASHRDLDTESESSYHGEGPERAQSSLRESLKPFIFGAGNNPEESSYWDTDNGPSYHGEGPEPGQEPERETEGQPARKRVKPNSLEPAADFTLPPAFDDKMKRTPAKTPSPQEESFYARPSVRIPMPDYLKNLLVDDWENVTKSMLLVPLPSKAPANFIFDEYWNQEKVNRIPGSAEAQLLEEVVIGMKQYFEASIGKLLLYRFERPQWQEVCSEARVKIFSY